MANSGKRSPQRTSLTQSSSKQSNMATTVIDLDIPKPVERAVEARSASDVEGSIVRTLYFADTFLLNGQFVRCVVRIIEVDSLRT